MTPKPIIPSGAHLTLQIDRAMRAFDADREQAILRAEARATARAEGFEIARARAIQQARSIAFWMGE